ncbi:hypothetical protein QBC42DRAFT_322503, partial [Cladorrhinum samala]
MCDLPPENPTPFCGPPHGTQFRTGDSVDIIWSPRFFRTSPTSIPRRIRIQADYFFPNNNTRTGTGFTSLVMSPNSGRFAWKITDGDLPAGVNALTAAIFIAEPFTDSDGNGTTLEGNDRFEGPRVGITRGNRRTDGPGGTGGINTTGGAIVNDNNNNNNNNNNSNNPASNMGAIGSGGPNAVAIALPVVFGALTLMLMTALVVFKRRNPGWSLREAIVKGVPGMLRRKLRPAGPRAGMMGGPAVVKRAGTGKRIRGEDIRVVTTDINGLRMNAMRMAGGGVGGSGNVFREELRRQER